MKRTFLAAISVIIFTCNAFSQNPLPDFLAEEAGKNKVRIAWVNPFGDSCIQLMVQTSFDSLRNFKTIFSTESPQLPQNGFIYTLPFQASFYYRIFYVLGNNTYYFTPSKKAGPSPYPDTANDYNDPGKDNGLSKSELSRIITIRNKDSVLAKMEYGDYRKFKDSVIRKTKDTLFVLSRDEVLLKPFNPENIWKPSVYVVMNKDGFVQIKLPDATQKNYKLIFFEPNGKKLFTINHIPETDLVIDKTNFLHAGWFKFELYENDQLKEKNKILLQRDF